MTRALILLSLFAGSSVLASAGSGVREAAAQPLCRIQMRTSTGVLIGTCSGTLISPTEVLTAAHCAQLPADVTLKVECGYLGHDPKKLAVETTSKGNQMYIGGVMFAETHDVVGKTIDSRYLKTEDSVVGDAAKLTLKEPSALTPNKNIGDYKPGSVCIVSGFGIGPSGIGGLPTMGLLRSTMSRVDGHITAQRDIVFIDEKDVAIANELIAELNAKRPTKEESIKIAILFLSKKELVSAAHLPGDSGGALFCRASEKEAWSLVGINSQTGVSLFENKMPKISVFNDWATPDLVR